jgi:hypothetical protein
MGIYISIRGWLECDDLQLEAIWKIILKYEDYYSGGWETPRTQYNGTFIFYVANVREQALPWFLEQLRAIAVTRASMHQGDEDYVRGFFLTSHEVDGMSEFHVYNGQVFVTPASARFRFLDQ